jgi:hypothetical protein
MFFKMAPLAFDTLVTIPLVIKTIQIRRQGGGKSALIQTFLREGVFYFLLVGAASPLPNIHDVTFIDICRKPCEGSIHRFLSGEFQSDDQTASR